MSRNRGSGYLVEMIVYIFLSNFESQLFQVFSRVLCALLDSLQIFSNFQQVIVLGRSQSQFVVRFLAISVQPTHFSYPCSQVAVLSELAILGRTFSRQFVKVERCTGSTQNTVLPYSVYVNPYMGISREFLLPTWRPILWLPGEECLFTLLDLLTFLAIYVIMTCIFLCLSSPLSPHKTPVWNL